MALRDGQPALTSSTALFVLTTQQSLSATLGPVDFLISGLFHNASLRVAPVPGRRAAWRLAVDLPADFCGQATLGLRDPGAVTAAGTGRGACGSGAAASATVTFTRVCGPEGRALVPTAGVTIMDDSDTYGHCIPALF
jgi:hypothetical protein